jgi:hypothetical protein
MLWYKNWFETKSRFVFNLIMITGVFAFLGILLLVGAIKPDQNNPDYLILTLVSLIGFMTVAGNGVRTQAGHLTMKPNPKSTIYTLSLPVSRCRLLLMRSALGLLEGTVLSLICVIFMWILLQGRVTILDFTNPLLVTIVCGIWVYFVTTFLSTFVNEGLYIWIYWFILVLYYALVIQGWMPPYLHILKVVESPIGTRIMIPWLSMALYLAMGGIFLFASIKVLESQEH